MNLFHGSCDLRTEYRVFGQLQVFPWRFLTKPPINGKDSIVICREFRSQWWRCWNNEPAFLSMTLIPSGFVVDKWTLWFSTRVDTAQRPLVKSFIGWKPPYRGYYWDLPQAPEDSGLPRTRLVDPWDKSGFQSIRLVCLRYLVKQVFGWMVSLPWTQYIM